MAIDGDVKEVERSDQRRSIDLSRMADGQVWIWRSTKATTTWTARQAMEKDMESFQGFSFVYPTDPSFPIFDPAIGPMQCNIDTW